ncbi:Ig-like domain repeat protein, partial [Methanobrevibacter sp.]|uniref:Ig-like domain repeat protein n=1 Tax=Methanobrevibacter sp. TaxID=66852 RepID=UPI00388EEBD7
NGTIEYTTTPEGLNVSFIPDESGVVSISDNGTVTAIKAGTAQITITVGDDKKYAINKTVITVTVSKIPTEILIQNKTLDMEVGNEADPVVSLMPSNAGNLSFVVSDESVILVNSQGIVTAVGEGNATVTVSFRGNDKYLPSNATITVTVSKVEFEPQIAMDNNTLTVTVPENATGNVTLTVGNETLVAPIENCVATFDLSDVPAGDYNATVSYPGDDKYTGFDIVYPISIENDFIITAEDLTKYYHGPERFTVNLTDSKGNPIANANISISINGKNYTRTTDDKGQAFLAINLNAGEYPVVVTYNSTSVDATVTVLPTVNGTDIIKVFRNGTQYYATFRDSLGNYLPEGTTVRFNIHGVMYDRKVSGDKGLAKLNINLNAGEYVITAMNPVTGDMTANNITVLSRLIENADLVKYFRNASQYTVKVIDDEGKAVGAGENVTFNINGVFYTRQTDANGIAKLNINLHPGDYVITAEYKGCLVSNNIKVLPILNATDITMKYRDGTKFMATLVDGQGKPYANQTVQFNINGVFYNRPTDSTGTARLNINLMPAEYIITSSYNGSSIANKITIKS